jgi:uncharacterized protein (TIGR00299 family) protein
MRVAYFDCIAGITGETALAALVDAGVDIEEIRKLLGTLPLEPFDIVAEEVEEQGLRATRVTVRTETTGVIRTYAGVQSILDAGDLPPEAHRIASRTIRLLAEAEARVHRREPASVSFHDVGGLDVIVAAVGTAVGLTTLGIERVFSSAVPTGLGMTRTEHGALPIPTPTVLELLRGAPLFSRGVAAELTNAMGAAILAATVEGYGELPTMRVETIGYGAGVQRLDFPNLFRVMIGQDEPAAMRPSVPGTPGLHLVTEPGKPVQPGDVG